MADNDTANMITLPKISGASTPRPEWLRSVLERYQTEGHAFLLSGPGIYDIDSAAYSLQTNIYHVFGNSSVPNKPPQLEFDMVVTYDRFNGFGFVGPANKKSADRELFKQIVEGKTASGQNDLASPGMGGIRGGPSGAAPRGDILDRSKSAGLAIPLINEALRQTEVRICLILNEFQALAPRGDWDKIGEMMTTSILACRSWGLDFEVVGGYGRNWKSSRAGHIIFGVTDDKSEVSSVLSRGRTQSGWISVNVGFPRHVEREYFIRENILTPDYLDKIEISFGDNVLPDQYVSWLAGATGGLTIRAIEDMRLTGQRNNGLSREMVQKIINSTISEQFEGQGGSNYLTVINPTRGLRGYGFPEYMVSYLEWFLKQFRLGKLRNSNILEAGPPGTGKSILAYALAYELGYKCVHWSPALTQSKWVGDTEKQLQQVLNWVEANLPCMMFVDEIDVAMTSRDGGAIDTSGVGSKMLSILMPWLEREEIKGKLLFVGATNRPDNIDGALKRRLQTIIPVLPPMLPVERARVIRNVLIREQGVQESVIDIPEDILGETTHWFTQANLSILCEKAVSIASRQGSDFSKDVAGFLRKAAVLYRVDTSRTEALSYLAAAQSSDQDLLPPGFVVKQEREVKKLLREVEDDDAIGSSARVAR